MGIGFLCSGLNKCSVKNGEGEIRDTKTNILDMDKTIRFELNSRMCNFFRKYNIDYRINPNVEIPKEILKYLKRGIVKRKDKYAKGCWTYKYNRQFALTYSIDDTIGNEASNSEIFISAQNDDLSVSRTIKIALTYIYALSELMKQYRNEFSIILSYEYIRCGTEPTYGFDIRFHQIRGNDSYLVKNLEVYNKHNGILVLNILNTPKFEAKTINSPHIST